MNYFLLFKIYAPFLLILNEFARFGILFKILIRSLFGISVKRKS